VPEELATRAYCRRSSFLFLKLEEVGFPRRRTHNARKQNKR